MSATDAVRVELYRSFIEQCRAPDIREMSDRLGMSPKDIRSALRDLAELDVIAFQPGTEDVWLAHPFCATEAPFSVTAGALHWNSICVWDALGILALTEADGRVETACPDCGEFLTVEVVGGKATAPVGTIVHYGVPARSWYENVAFT